MTERRRGSTGGKEGKKVSGGQSRVEWDIMGRRQHGSWWLPGTG